MVEASAQPRPRSNWSPVSLLLIALMALGSVLMWLGVPVGLIYLASRIADSPTPSMGPYLLILIGLPVGMVAVGKVLGALDRADAVLLADVVLALVPHAAQPGGGVPGRGRPATDVVVLRVQPGERHGEQEDRRREHRDHREHRGHAQVVEIALDLGAHPDREQGCAGPEVDRAESRCADQADLLQGHLRLLPYLRCSSFATIPGRRGSTSSRSGSRPCFRAAKTQAEWA